MIDIRKANRWRILPKVRHVNYRKEFPQMSDRCFTRLFDFKRYWGGRIWNFYCRHHCLEFDWRYSWVNDMCFPGATKADRKAVNDATKEIQ